MSEILITRNTVGSKLECLQAMFCSDSFMMTRLKIVWFYEILETTFVLGICFKKQVLDGYGTLVF